MSIESKSLLNVAVGDQAWVFSSTMRGWHLGIVHALSDKDDDAVEVEFSAGDLLCRKRLQLNSDRLVLASEFDEVEEHDPEMREPLALHRFNRKTPALAARDAGPQPKRHRLLNVAAGDEAWVFSSTMRGWHLGIVHALSDAVEVEFSAGDLLCRKRLQLNSDRLILASEFDEVEEHDPEMRQPLAPRRLNRKTPAPPARDAGLQPKRRRVSRWNELAERRREETANLTRGFAVRSLVSQGKQHKQERALFGDVEKREEFAQRADLWISAAQVKELKQNELDLLKIMRDKRIDVYFEIGQATEPTVPSLVLALELHASRDRNCFPMLESVEKHVGCSERFTLKLDTSKGLTKNQFGVHGMPCCYVKQIPGGGCRSEAGKKHIAFYPLP